MCILWCVYTLLKIASHYGLSVLSMSVMGLTKKLDREWVVEVGSIQLIFLICLNFCCHNYTSPVAHWLVDNAILFTSSRASTI